MNAFTAWEPKERVEYISVYDICTSVYDTCTYLQKVHDIHLNLHMINIMTVYEVMNMRI